MIQKFSRASLKITDPGWGETFPLPRSPVARLEICQRRQLKRLGLRLFGFRYRPY